MGYGTIKTRVHKKKVGIITLDRPDSLNSLTSEVMREVVSASTDYDSNQQIGCIVLTGSEKAFAAGADIKEMESLTYMDAWRSDFFAGWDEFCGVRTPIIGAVSGYALGGGCELAMMCDFIIAADNARFGQPEITLGVMPGMGGSQRLTRFVGKSKAMDMCLTGRMMDAEEAERCGLVSRVVPVSSLMNETLEAAEKIANFSAPSTAFIKESVNRAYEGALSEGIIFERRLFHSLFSTDDQSEGMRAFIEKRPAKFRNK